MTNNGLSVIANDDQTILLSAAVPLQACLDSHKFAWIPQNDHIGHIGSMRVVVWPRNVKP